MGSFKRSFIVLIFTLSTALCFAQKPIAHYTSICKILCQAPLIGPGYNQVTFNYDGTGGTPTSYSWSFPGGTPSTSTAQNPGTITFSNVGTYLVKVTATNGAGSTPFTDTIFVLSNCAANYKISSKTFCPGTCVNYFDSSNFRPDTWNWTFSNGSGTNISSTSQNPTNICYPSSGQFTIKLIASRTNTNCIQTFSLSAPISVKKCPPVTVTINSSNNAPCKGDCISFTSHITSGTGPFTYAWTFQGSTGKAKSATDSLPQTICYPTIPAQGSSYAATLVVTDANGKSATSTINITPVSCVPTAHFKVISAICNTQCITFADSSYVSATNGGNVTGWTWTVSGPSQIAGSSNQNPTICFPKAGTYTVTEVATNASGTSTPFSRPVVVNSCPPTADFSFSPTAPFCQGGCATFTNHSVNGIGGKITSWVWNFQTSTGTTNYTTDSLPPAVCYTDAGTYTATLQITNAAGTSQVFSQSVVVRYCPPPVNVNFTTFSGQATIPNNDVCRDSCIRITNNTTGANGYLWLFISRNAGGTLDTTTFNGANPPPFPINTPGNCFAVPGDTGFVHVILFASSPDSTKTLDELIHVHICSGLFPKLKASETSICVGSCINYTDETTEQAGTAPPVVWQWTFDGGSPATQSLQNPGYICYQYPGIYPVKLVVSNGTATNSVTYNSLITVNQPVQVSTSFDSTTVVLGNSLPLFASGGVSYQWTPINNLDDPLVQNPIFTPIDTGVVKYTVVMTDVNGCSSSKTIIINVIPPDLVTAPNVFTPNGDYINDKFDVFVSGAYSSMEMHVYDRWGELIYSTKVPGNEGQTVGWDGTYKGKPVNDGVYVYYFSVSFSDGTVIKRAGDVTLLR